MSDAQILLNSFEHAQEKSKKTTAGKLLSVLPLLFTASAAAMYGAMKKGPLSSKMLTAAAAMFSIGLAGAICDKTNDVADRVKAKSQKFNDFEKKHPLLSIVGDFALKAALIAGAFAGISKGGKSLQKHFEPGVEALSKGMEHAAKMIDKSKLGKQTAKLSENFNAFVQKHPKVSDFAAKHPNFAPLTFLFGWMGISAAVNKKVVENQFDIASQRACDLVLLRSVANHIDTL